MNTKRTTVRLLLEFGLVLGIGAVSLMLVPPNWRPLVLSMAGVTALGLFIEWLFLALARHFERQVPKNGGGATWVPVIVRPARWTGTMALPALMALGLWWGLYLADLSEEAKPIRTRTTQVLVTVVVYVLVRQLLVLAHLTCARMAERTPSRRDDHLVALVFRMAGVLLLVATLGVVVYELFQLNVAAVVWGTISAIAATAAVLVSLDVLKDLLGAAIVIADRPFEKGDEIRLGSHQGVVVEVGIRSTVIRTSGGEQVTVPNNLFLREAVAKLPRDGAPAAR